MYQRAQRHKQKEHTNRESFPKQVAVALMSSRVVTVTRDLLTFYTETQ